MTQKELILAAFRENGGHMTLGQMLQHPWGYEVRARFSNLRADGFRITCTKGKRPSENLYTLYERELHPFDETGQGILFGGAR